MGQSLKLMKQMKERTNERKEILEDEQNDRTKSRIMCVAILQLQSHLDLSVEQAGLLQSGAGVGQRLRGN
jgi:hypothetical protein